MESSPLRIAVIVAHPRRRSFTVAMAEAFSAAARAEGAEVVERDLDAAAERTRAARERAEAERRRLEGR